jgi:hypothetical protein
MSSRSTVITTFITDMETDVSKQSPAYKIFHWFWDIALPHMYVYTDDYMRQTGVVQSGDAVYDSRLPNTMVGGRYTIAQMAALMDEGATIRLDRPEDSKAIYDIINQHLENWSNSLNRTNSFDLKKAPENDLMLLSQLADVLYGYAKRFFQHERPRGSLARKFDQIRGRGAALGGRRRRDPTAQTPEQQKVEMQGHAQYTENILTKSAGRDKWS